MKDTLLGEQSMLAVEIREQKSLSVSCLLLTSGPQLDVDGVFPAMHCRALFVLLQVPAAVSHISHPQGGLLPDAASPQP